MVDLSVIIVNWNTAELLTRCLAAVFAALEGLKNEVIVIDNASSDGSAEMVRARFPMVRLIQNDANRGFAVACNQGIRMATGRHLLLLNSDAIVGQGAIATMLETMEGDATIGILGARLLNEDGTLQNSVANTPSLMTEAGKKSLLKRLFPGRFYARSFQPPGPVDVESLVGACVMVRSAMVAKIGLLDEAFFFFMEETDWCVRARAAGWRVVFQPHALVTHLQGRSASKVWAGARIEYWRSRYRFFGKHYGLGTRVALAIALQIELWIDILYFVLLSPFSAKARGRVGVCVRILLWHLAGRPAHWGLPGERGREGETMAPARAARRALLDR